MRIAVLGAGAMGSWFGGELALAGSEVRLLTTNAAHREAVAANGLTLRRAAGDERNVRLPIHAPAELDAPVDLVLLFTKSFQSDAALAAVAPLLSDDAVVLGLQNGLGNAETIARHVPLERVLVGVSMMPVDRVVPGTVASKGEGVTRFGLARPTGDAPAGDASDGADDGGADDGVPPIARRILDAFAPTGMDVRFDADVHRAIWEKAAFNAGMNASCALSGGTPGTVGRLDEARELVREVAREVATVGAARGVAVDLDAVFRTIDYACAHHGGHKASMLQDLEAGRRTEVESLNGAVVALGEAAGVPAPLNRTLATLVRLAERARSADA